MPLRVMDTDIATALMMGDAGVQVRVAALSSAEVGTTVVTVQEMFAGWLPHLTRQQPADRYVLIYARLRQALQFLSGMTMLDFDMAAAAEYTRLRATYRRIGTNDLRIAAITLVNNAIVVTRNVRDFGQVAGLVVEDWST